MKMSDKLDSNVTTPFHCQHGCKLLEACTFRAEHNLRFPSRACKWKLCNRALLPRKDTQKKRKCTSSEFCTASLFSEFLLNY